MVVKFLIGFIIGAAITILINYIYISKKKVTYDGVLVINTHDPEKDLYSFEINGLLDELEGKKELRILVRKD